MQSLPLHTSCLLSMLLNDNIVDIEVNCSVTILADESITLHTSKFSIIH